VKGECWDGAYVAFCPLGDPADGADLSPRELALVAAATSESRRREIRAGRRAAHAALKAAGVSALPEVLTSTAGRPSLDPPAGWFVSLAHDGGLAVAACARRPVGIDVVPFSRRPQVERVVRASLQTGTAIDLPIFDTPWPPALVLWSAWEAIGKQGGGGVFEAMRASIRPEMSGDTAAAVVATCHLRWWTHGEHLFCLATDTE
jgi:4'-phosphopantetheinyl transferase EntD